MDFARKQLEKYGWTDGKGLGKNENGISKALKPKLKRSVTGVGHDPASEFNDHWWTMLYDKAAKNVEVKESDGATKKIKTKEDFSITNDMWQMKRNFKRDGRKQYSDHFVRTSVMTGGRETENVKESEPEGEVENREVNRMTDEELFAACGGRTAHKGARHGLKASGKLARIAQQEEILLSQSKYNGYSHAKKSKEVVEDVREEITFKTEEVPKRKKKKKRKRCISDESRSNEVEEAELAEDEAQGELEKEHDAAIMNDKIKSQDNNIAEDNTQECKRKRKRKNIEPLEIMTMEIDIEHDNNEKVKRKNKKRKKLKNICNG